MTLASLPVLKAASILNKTQHSPEMLAPSGCFRTYLVNLSFVVTISAQGQMLKFILSNITCAVSFLLSFSPVTYLPHIIRPLPL